MRNEDIKKAAKEAGIRLWRIAEKLGITDAMFSRKLRYEIPEEERKQIFSIIEQLKGECEWPIRKLQPSGKP